MVRRKREVPKDFLRIQFDLTPERVQHLQNLQEGMRALSYRETFESLIKLGMYIEQQLGKGETALDLAVVKALCFT
jgi:hypothetical protein